MRRAGKIREDFGHTDAGVSSVREFFELIDGKPDENHFHTFCALFMTANAPDADANQAVLDIELMGILKEPASGRNASLNGFAQRNTFMQQPSVYEPKDAAPWFGRGLRRSPTCCS